MVLLKEVTDGIWGLIVEPNKIYETVVDKPFRLTMACLEVDSVSNPSDEITRLTTKATTTGQDSFVLCNLHVPMCLQQSLYLEFMQGQTMSFAVKGPHKVHLTGYILTEPAAELCEENCDHDHHGMHAKEFFRRQAHEHEPDSDDDDSEDESDESESDEEDESSSDDGGALLPDDQDQDMNADYEDGYLEGESSDDEDDDDDDETSAATLGKGKKRLRDTTNGILDQKKETKKKKMKKIKLEQPMSAITSNTEKGNNEDETVKNDQQSSTSASPPPSASATVASHGNGTSTMSKRAAKKLKQKARQEAVATAMSSTPDTHSSSSTGAETKNSSQPQTKKLPHGLELHDLKVGMGPEATLGKTVAVYYVGRLKTNNKQFDACTQGKPFRFKLGAGAVIKGWDQGVKGMKVGGKRRLIVPASLAYGNQKMPDIPAGSTLVFDVELKNVF